MRTVVSIPARMASERLPGKVASYLSPFEPAILELLISRFHTAAFAVVVGTTTLPEDDAIERMARDAHAMCVRIEPGTDLIALHHAAMMEIAPDVMLLAGADDPFLDPALFRLIEARLAVGDVSYVRTQGWPLGLNVWGWTAEALDEAHERSVAPEERQHVVPYFERRPVSYPRAILSRHSDLYGLYRLTVDTQADLDMARRLWPLVRDDVRAENLIETLNAHPEIWAINDAGLHGYAARDLLYDLTPIEDPLRKVRDLLRIEERAARANIPEQGAFAEGRAAALMSVQQWLP
jgi:spore coat polysaccharide biosynthesis protein SpsF